MHKREPRQLRLWIYFLLQHVQENRDFCQKEVNQDLSWWKMKAVKSAAYIPEIMRAHVFFNCREPAILQAPVHAESQPLSALQLFNMQGLL